MKPAEAKRLAELAGCTLSSPGGTGLYVGDGATAEVQGGTIAGCGYGVYCDGWGGASKATVRTAPPRHRAKLRARWRRFLPACPLLFRPLFGSLEPLRRED